jgi:electron transport complex protein RnfG
MTPTGPMIKVLGTVSLVCGVLIVGTNLTTIARIRQNQETIMRESVTNLLPGLQKQVIYRVGDSGELTIVAGVEGENVKRLFAGYDGSGKLLGVVIEASERGYADLISAMYAYQPDKKVITGFQVVDMRETPGLGNRIGSDEKFAENFKSLDATHPIKTVKHGTKQNPWEIDAISGATISSRAVGRMLQKSVQDMTPVIEKNLDRIKRGN